MVGMAEAGGGGGVAVAPPPLDDVAEAGRAAAEELAAAVGSKGSGVLGSRQPSRPFWNWKS